MGLPSRAVQTGTPADGGPGPSPAARRQAHRTRPDRAGLSLLRSAALVAGKDLRVELSSRVTTTQVLPFGGIVLLLTAFAADPDRAALARVAPGMFWTAVLLAAVLAAGRSAALEVANGADDGLRLSRLDPGGIFLGKVAAVFVQLAVLETVLLAGLVAVYDFRIAHPVLLLASAVSATAGICAVGVVYGAVAAALRTRETLLPLLALPVLTPEALGGAQAWLAVQRPDAADGLRWLQLLTLFGCVLLAAGLATYGSLLEEG
jgi:heme exporter protein B